MTNKVVIIGSGMGGGVLAKELLSLDFDVTVLDIDFLDKDYDNDLQLDINLTKSYFHEDKAVGYGFGGTTNLWHGVIGDFDESDWINYCLNNKDKNYLRSALEENYDQFCELFGPVKDLNNISNEDIKIANRLFKLKNFEIKKYLVLNRPLRTRNLIKSLLHNKKFKIIEGATALKFKLDENESVSGIEYFKGDKIYFIGCDFYVVAAGALESPRIIRTLPKLNKNSFGLLDHPQLMIGKARFNKKILYNLIGLPTPFRHSVNRLGFVIKDKFKDKLEGRNISIFLRPDLGIDNLKRRDMLKKIIFNPSLKKIFKYCFQTPGAWKVIFELIIEKFGLGFYTRNLLIYVQFEQFYSDNNNLIFSDKIKDKFGRSIPQVRTPSSLFSENCFKNLKELLFDEISNANIEFEKYDDIAVTTGAHFSGTLPFGIEEDYMVDLNLRLKKYPNVYICDASIFPFIGNVNLSLNIVKFACRLAKHFKDLRKKY